MDVVAVGFDRSCPYDDGDLPSGVGEGDRVEMMILPLFDVVIEADREGPELGVLVPDGGKLLQDRGVD